MAYPQISLASCTAPGFARFSLLRLKTFQIDSGLLIQNLILSGHYLDQVWDWANYLSETRQEILGN